MGQKAGMGKTLLAMLALMLMLGSSHAATISGTTFEWYSLEPLSNVIIDVNTVPKQTLVATDGTYSFDILEPGSYLINAQFFENNELKYEAEEVLSITGDGDFRLDLILFPSLEDDFLFDEFGDMNVVVVAEPDNGGVPGQALLYIGLIAFAGLAFYIFITRHKPSHAMKGTAAEKPPTNEKLSAQRELDEVLGIIKNYGGRITQKDLREKLPHSEAKVSLIVAELEHMGKIKKFKKGRGNIIVLNE